MFNHIVQYYQNKIYKKHKKRPIKSFQIKEKIHLLILLVGIGGYVICGLCEKMFLMMAFLTLLCIGVFIVLRDTNNRYEDIADQLNEFEGDKIRTLENLLRDTNIHLYDAKSIQWLIEMCEIKLSKLAQNELRSPVKSVFDLFIYPILVAAGAIIIKDRPVSQIMFLCGAAIGVSVVCLILYIGIYPELKAYMDKEKNMIEAFKHDLEYISLKLSE